MNLVTEKYERRFVAFVDILGFQELVHRIEKNPNTFLALEYALRNIVSITNTSVDLRDSDIRASTFSDCIVTSARNNPSGLFSLTMQISNLCAQLLMQGTFTRGGIIEGNLFHDETIVFGSGLIDAYHLEKNEAKNPRILIHPRVYSFAMEHKDPEDSSESLSRFFRLDSDNRHYLDILSGQLYKRLVQDNLPIPPETGLRVVYMNIRDVLEKKLVRGYCPKIHSKVEWFVRYFNEVVKANPTINLSPISLPEDG